MEDNLVDEQRLSKGHRPRLSQANIDLAEFLTLDSSAIRCRYPALLELYKYRISNDKRNRDALCNACGKMFIKSKVSRLVNHSKKCPASSEILVKSLESAYKNDERHKVEAGILKKSNPELKKLRKAFDDQIIELFANNSLSLNLIQSRELKNILTSVDATFQLPTLEKFTALLTARSFVETSKVIVKFKEADNYSLTIELSGYSTWLAVTLTSNSGLSCLLDLIDISSDPNSSNYIASKALTAIQNSKIPDSKFNAIISDDVSHFLLARDIIYEDFNRGRMIEYRSFAHVLNQMCGSIVKSLQLKDTFEKLSQLVEATSGNRFLIAKLREKGQQKVCDSIPTSSSTPSVCINWALQIKNALMKMPKTDRYQSPQWESLLEDKTFWYELDKSQPFFEKFSLAIKIASTSRLSDAFHAFIDFGKFLTLNESLDSSIKDLFIEAYVTYFNQLDLDILFTAHVLDPNKKMANLTSKAVRMAKDYMAKMVTTMGHKDDVTKVAINEFKRYTQSLKSIEEIEDIYSWWSSFDRDGIILKVIASRLAAASASLVNSKRVQLVMGQHLNRDNSNMLNVYDLLTINIAQTSNSPTRRMEISLEAPLLDQNVINTCLEMTEDSGQFYASSDYLEFKSLIDYGGVMYSE